MVIEDAGPGMPPILATIGTVVFSPRLREMVGFTEKDMTFGEAVCCVMKEDLETLSEAFMSAQRAESGGKLRAEYRILNPATGHLQVIQSRTNLF
ncbi:MAG: hypothetical protein BGO21_08050 [Dyadobacter sp. 50-39]|uniref:PAS domain-containing protein n=1 Tax=Dyadobacter sp. 50-39 TaxID=1895756 RepID=UPI000961F42C|nr:PAS domain-containing protein [Dyadobacter sp. 50-39]OJV20519.1 MAG: hypothetical protein BGO21_08050 [Dyadobacter sp. 50-39]